MDTYTDIYSTKQLDHIESDFKRLKEEYYLEHAGATLYSDTQIANILNNLTSNLYGNPHAHSISSKLTGDAVDNVRYQILDFFNTSLDEYDVIFTSGATAALKLVAETFQYGNTGADASSGGSFVYLEDNHTSVVGMREYATNVQVLAHDEAFQLFNNASFDESNRDYECNSLFVYPSQCNFSGTKYPLSWIKKVQNGALNQITMFNAHCKWFCMLDAASYVSTNRLDLNIYKPDFVCMSFYKIFGYPTGLGALLVRNNSARVLKKVYFGGGTVKITLPREHVFRETLHERFEDGTLPFLAVLSVRHGLETLKRLDLTMDLISMHTFSLARHVHHCLLRMHHANGNPLAILYHDTNFQNVLYQGGIVNFNLLRDNGEFIGYSEVLQIANLYKFHLRTGCFCNPGACQRHLGLSPQDARHHFQAGHVCGDENDLIDGNPTGSVRISFGYMSRKEDADKFLEMIENCFVTKPVVKKFPSDLKEFEKQYNMKFMGRCTSQNMNDSPEKSILNKFPNEVVSVNEVEVGELTQIIVYPVKSCGGFSVSDKWLIEPTGLKFDREWMIVATDGVCITQKQEPRLCLIKPNINETEGVLQLRYVDSPDIKVPLDIGQCAAKSEISLCLSKVCGDRVKCFDCGDEAADWLGNCLNRSDLRLLQKAPSNARVNKKGENSQLSLVNQAQYLLLNSASVKQLASFIPDLNCGNNVPALSNLMARFRANFIINSVTPNIENACDIIAIGKLKFKCLGPCTRCQMICIDQETSSKTVEPLRTLSLQTRGKTKFGVYLEKIHSDGNTIRLGEKVVFKKTNYRCTDG